MLYLVIVSLFAGLQPCSWAFAAYLLPPSECGTASFLDAEAIIMNYPLQPSPYLPHDVTIRSDYDHSPLFITLHELAPTPSSPPIPDRPPLQSTFPSITLPAGIYGVNLHILPPPIITYDDSPAPAVSMLSRDATDPEDSWQAALIIESGAASFSTTKSTGCEGRVASSSSAPRDKTTHGSVQFDALISVESGDVVLTAGYARGRETVVTAGVTIHATPGAAANPTPPPYKRHDSIENFDTTNYMYAMLFLVTTVLVAGLAAAGKLGFTRSHQLKRN